MDIIEQLVRSYAPRTTQNGVVVLVSDGHSALAAAFRHLGWSDPYPDPLLLPPPDVVDVSPVVVVTETATAPARERAVLPTAKGRYAV